MNNVSIDEKEELLVIFMEECAEASVEASKIIRFGQNDEEIGSLVKGWKLMYDKFIREYE